jgi:hypothetical protein
MILRNYLKSYGRVKHELRSWSFRGSRNPLNLPIPRITSSRNTGKLIMVHILRSVQK